MYNITEHALTPHEMTKHNPQCLDLKDPAIVQGMYIFKNPGIGGVQEALAPWPDHPPRGRGDPTPGWNLPLQRAAQALRVLVPHR